MQSAAAARGGPGALLRLGLAILFGLAVPGGMRAGPVAESQRTATFLFNLAKFVEWPADGFESPDAPILICVLGPKAFGDALEKAVPGKSIGGRRFAIRHLSASDPALDCRILYVNPSENKRFRAMAGALKANSVLTVGEGEGFAAEGGIFSVKFEGDKVSFEINTEAAEQARLQISSKLLSLSGVCKK